MRTDGNVKVLFADLKQAKSQGCLSSTDCMLLRELRRSTKNLLSVMDLVAELHNATATALREMTGEELEIGMKIPPAVKSRALELFAASRSRGGRA